jgi:hypothetical protein
MMSTWVDFRLDVLASDPEEIQVIELALQEPCEELTAWYAKVCKENSPDLKEIVAFKRTQRIGYVDKARRFDICVEYEDSGLVWSHIQLVSKHFPKAIFLAEYWNIPEPGITVFGPLPLYVGFAAKTRGNTVPPNETDNLASGWAYFGLSISRSSIGTQDKIL